MKRIIGLVCVIMGIGFCGASMAADSTWTSASGGDFQTPGNWDNGVPGAADSAKFTNGAYTVTWSADAANNEVTNTWTTATTLTYAIGSYKWLVTNKFNVGTGATDKPSIIQASGTLSVTNAATNAYFYFGKQGYDCFYTLQGGTLNADYMEYGNGAGSGRNVFTVAGNSSVANVSNTFYLHYGDDNALIITNQGAVNVGAGILYIGGNTLGYLRNYVLVTGTNSVLRVDTANLPDKSIMVTSADGYFKVSRGGYCTNASYIVIGVYCSRAGAIVTDTGSVFEVNGVNVGYWAGDGYSNRWLMVTNGGVVKDWTYCTLGWSGTPNGSTGAQVTVTDPGSELQVQTYLHIGQNSPATLNVLNGGSVLARSYLSLGPAVGGRGDLIVSGTGSVVRVADYLSLSSPPSTMTITNGGTVLVTNRCNVSGGSPANTGNVVIVTGPGSLFRVGGDYIAIGEEGGFNRFTVSEQGTVVVATNCYIGKELGSTGNVVTVSGPSSLLQVVGGNLRVGDAGRMNTLIVTNQGTVSATNCCVGFNAASTGNLLRVSSGNLYVTNSSATGLLDLQRGDLIVQGAGGTIVVDSLVMTNANATNTLAFVADANGLTTVKVNAAFKVNSSQDKLNVDFSALRGSGSYVLAQYGSMPTKFTNITVTGSSWSYTLDQITDNKITLRVIPSGTIFMGR